MSTDAIRNWLIRHTEIEPSLLADPALQRVVEERLRRQQLSDGDAYLEQLAQSPAEMERLIASIAVPESWFFRYPASFALLTEHLSAALERADTSSTLRLLSLACASGEEACSMAMTALHAGWPADRVIVDAVDLDRDLISVARSGRYRGASLRSELPDWARKHVLSASGEVRVAPPILAMIRYHHGDVFHSEGLDLRPPYEAVFCRNLLIYVRTSARLRLAERLAEWVAPDGLLFVGHAERTELFAGGFTPQPAPHAFALRRSVGAAPSPAVGVKRAARRVPPMLAAPAPAPKMKSRATLSPTTTASPGLLTLADARDLADRGQIQPALLAARAVLSREGPTPATLELLGTVQLAAGALEAARESLRKAIYLAPEHESALLQLALVSERLGHRAEAARYRRRAERIHQRNEQFEKRDRDR